MSHRLIGRAGFGATAVALLLLLPASLSAQRRASAPTNVTVIGAGSSATVTWTPVPVKGVTYRVLRGLDARAAGIDLTRPTPVASLVDQKLEPGVTYFYQVIAVYGDGTSAAAAAVAFTLPSHSPMRRGPLTLSGQVVPLQLLPAGRAGTVLGAMARVQMAACNPAQPAGGPPPTTFTLIKSWPSGPEFDWPLVLGAVAYLVERAIDDGAYRWIIAGATCGSPDDIRAVQYEDGSQNLRFRDIIGGIVPGTQYVYKVSAVGAGGVLGWNSTRWTAPAQGPSVQLPWITGSTISLGYNVSCGHDLSKLSGATWVSEVLVTSSYGFSQVYPTGGGCGHHPRHTIHGVPIGTHTFTATMQWVQSLDPNLPRVIPTQGTSASTTFEIKP